MLVKSLKGLTERVSAPPSHNTVALPPNDPTGCDRSIGTCFEVWGLGSVVWGLRFGALGVGVWVLGYGGEVSASSGVWGSGIRVWDRNRGGLPRSRVCRQGEVDVVAGGPEGWEAVSSQTHI